MFPSDTAARIRDTIRDVLATDDIETIEYAIETPGETVWYEAKIAPIPGGYRGQPAVILRARNVTDCRAKEQELQRQNERLEEFASIVSHDLRNPINVAHGRLELASEECDSEHLTTAEDALDRCEALIEDLLTLARQGMEMESGEAVSLATVAEAAWDNVETESAPLVIEADRTVRANRSRLKQLLENLFRNAVEHCGATVTVTVAATDEGFVVADDGPGIPADEQDQVFEAGYSTRRDGTGFGLAIVDQIVEAHGWDIAVATEEGGGTRFEITGVDHGG